MTRIAVVTDSTAELPAEVAAAAGITVIPLPVTVGEATLLDGEPGAQPHDVVAALRARSRVATSRPAPATMVALYAGLEAEGYTAVVSVHLSSELSGTFESAFLAGHRSAIEVHAVDTRTVGPAIGFAALAAAAAIAAGASAAQAAAAARARAAESQSYFYVDSLEYLRRGGRIGSAAALVGSALSVKPLLTITGGEVVVKEKVRTAARAVARLEALAIDAVGSSEAELVVVHLGAPVQAEQLADRLAATLGDRLEGSVRVREMGAVIGAHVGPGLLGAAVAPALAR